MHFVTIPIHDSAAAEEELNRFLATHRVLSIDRQLVSDGPRSAWAVCISYAPPDRGTPASTGTSAQPQHSRVDYKELLSPEQFAVFAALRTLRKEIAERDSVPPYAIFNNDQLAQMVREQMTTVAQLSSIDGVGPARVKKYGAVFLERLAQRPEPSPPETD